MKMTDYERIRQVFYDFEDGGLVSKDIHKVLNCLSDRLIGIGIGEQGFVTSKQEVEQIFNQSLKVDDQNQHSIEVERVEILKPADNLATLCAKINVIARGEALTQTSTFHQSMTFIREQEEWKICGLHASTIVVTDETLNAYPLKFADKTLELLKEKIGGEAYEQEEQYRQAILADTIAFYIIDFTEDIFEKCQLNGSSCLYTEPGMSYSASLENDISGFVLEEDIPLYLNHFSMEQIKKAYEDNKQQITCEYRMKSDSGYSWAQTITRLITDKKTGHQKGIMYVKNIDKKKREELAIRNMAITDIMTGVYNKEAMIQYINQMLSCPEEMSGGAFLMFDIDNFKLVNDTLGHPVGDEVLIKLARLLKTFFQKDCIVGRLGGDEFAVFLCSRTYQEQLSARLLQLMGAIEQIEIKKGSGLRLSCSIGIAVYRRQKTFHQIYKEADLALYRSKQSGKNQYHYYENL